MSAFSTSKICLIAVGLVLIACNVVCIAWLLTSKAQTTTQQRCYSMSPNSMPHILGNISSKAHCFLKVSKDDGYKEDEGPVKWDHEESPRGISLDEDGSRIFVNSSGHYLLFVQANFVFENHTGDRRLRLQLMTSDKDVPSPVIVWDEIQEVKGNSVKLVPRLSFLVLLELVQGQHIIVQARHRDKFSYNTPLSTFLTMIKYSNMQDAPNGMPVHT